VHVFRVRWRRELQFRVWQRRDLQRVLEERETEQERKTEQERDSACLERLLHHVLRAW
jgi:hypothetical protein